MQIAQKPRAIFHALLEHHPYHPLNSMGFYQKKPSFQAGVPSHVERSRLPPFDTRPGKHTKITGLV